MALFRRVWQKLLRPSYLAGRDLQGNRFYERPSTSDDPRRTKRAIEYRSENDKWDYIGGARRLPVQWSAWLTHTRQAPPTIEELQADVQRQQRVLRNASLIEANDQQERARLRQVGASDMRQHTSEISDQPPPKKMPYNISQTPLSQSHVDQFTSDLPKTCPDRSDEPQSWTPRARSRDR
ncbi:hypothetical protein PILCRDRAFT_314793 [Piloderma croceum F 1598]|uniref:NADH dehydrogenase [ubiquinone] 1 alpha subcomplex subunit n=1 Tax=Piloderma croceum (strain F 1598) TaxID=765440 RepID=A0A0C3FS05_PILCF|nr:hypothetical protein PILCRDRAFT_314793 [Piloderma croceum F 1598]